MVAFKEEFPYLRCESGQLFEFDRDWLHAAITRAADQAGYPSWWLTDHVTESIAFYLRLRTDESVVAFSQLTQTVRYVLKVIGYKEIVPHFGRRRRRFRFRCYEIARSGGRRIRAGFFRSARKTDQCTHRNRRDRNCTFSVCSRRSNICAERKSGRAPATRLREEVICFIREKICSAAGSRAELSCSIR